MSTPTHSDPLPVFAGLPLFGQVREPLTLTELVARVQTDPPSVPVRSSERGAQHAKRKAVSQRARIIAELWKAGCLPGSSKYLSRDAIAERTSMTVNAACGRLAPSGPLLVPKGQTDGPWAVRAVEDAAVSASGGRVLGYQLTAYGLGLVEESHRAVA